MKKKLYQTIEDRELYEPTGTKPVNTAKQYRDLYRLGCLKIPVSMIYSSKYLSLSRSTKTVYLWLLTKKWLLAEMAKKGIMTEESVRYWDFGTCTTTAGEIEKYTGVGAKNVKRNLNELRNAGLIKTQQITAGGRKTATAYKVAEWKKDRRGNIRVPIKTIISPAFISLEHYDKLMYLIMLSQHGAARSKINQSFPQFMLPYSQIRSFGFTSDTTIMNVIHRLENAGLLEVKPGEWCVTPSAGRASLYNISADHIYAKDNSTDTNDNNENKPAQPGK